MNADEKPLEFRPVNIGFEKSLDGSVSTWTNINPG